MSCLSVIIKSSQTDSRGFPTPTEQQFRIRQQYLSSPDTPSSGHFRAVEYILKRIISGNAFDFAFRLQDYAMSQYRQSQ